MRKIIILAALGLFAGSTLLPEMAWAGKKDTEEAADGEEAFDIVMEETGSASLDAVFKKSETPLETIATINADVKAVNTGLVTALGLKDGTPFADALADLQSKAEGKINVAFEDNKMPKFEAAEGCPENVKTSIDALNSSFGKLGDAGDKLVTAGTQLGEAAGEAANLVSKPKDLGLKATQIPKATSKANKNIKKLKSGIELTKSLAEEVGTLAKDVRSSFGG